MAHDCSKPNHANSHTSRRTALKLLGVSSLAVNGLAHALKLSDQPPLFDTNNPEHLHQMHRKLAYTYDDRPVYWNIDAVRMGFKDGVLTPFWNMHVGMIFKVQTLSEFRYRVRHIIKIFYSDLNTGELIKTFSNPYTGEQRTVRQPKLVKSERTFGLNGVERPQQKRKPGAGTSMRNDRLGPAKVIGDDVWLNADAIFRSQPPNRLNRLIQVNDWSTYHGSLAELTDPSTTSAASTHTFNDINTFNHDWVGMQGVDAWSISRGFGRKNHSVDGMPEEWKRFVENTHPELLSDNPKFSD